jgi:hypothetical protein
MSKVAIQGNASGTGTFTIAAPNSNTDRTLTLPDEAGTVLTSAGAGTDYLTPTGDGSSLTGISSGLEFISTTDISNVATVDFTLPSGYDAYQFVLGNVVPATDSTALYIRTSSNGGSSFDAGQYDYAYAHSYYDMDVGNSEESKARSADYQIEATRSFVGSASGETGISGDVRVYFPSLSARTLVYGSLVFQNDSARHVKNEFGGARLSSASADAVRFLFNTGNLESGTITLYGMKNS